MNTKDAFNEIMKLYKENTFNLPLMPRDIVRVMTEFLNFCIDKKIDLKEINLVELKDLLENELKELKL